MSPILDKQRLREFVASWDDPKHPEEAVSEFCRQLVKESGIVTGSTVTVIHGGEDGMQFTVTDIDHAEAEVRGQGSGGWWPVEAVSLVKPTKRKTRTLAREGNR